MTDTNKNMNRHEVQIQNNKDNTRFTQVVFADNFAKAVESVEGLYSGWNITIVGGWESPTGQVFDGDKTPGAADHIDALEVQERCGVKCDGCGRIVNNVKETIQWIQGKGHFCMNCDGTPKKDDTVRIGDKVRSHDFPNNKETEGLKAFFVEGTVVAIHEDGVEGIQTCPLYEIKVSKVVRTGTEMTNHGVETIYPPVNGTEMTFGGVTDVVVKL